MIDKLLKIGDKIELSRELFAEDGTKTNRIYLSQLLDFVDNLTLDIAVPIESSHLVPLEVGSRYATRFFSTGGMYLCETEVIGRYKQGATYFLRVKMLTELKRDQRRKYFRLERIIDIAYHVIGREEKEITERLEGRTFRDDREMRMLEKRLSVVKGENQQGTIINISGGGVKLQSIAKLEADDNIFMEFFMDKEDGTTFLCLKGKIVYAGESKNSNQKYDNRVEFIDVSRLDREKIVKYIFGEERKLRKKENGL